MSSGMVSVGKRKVQIIARKDLYALIHVNNESQMRARIPYPYK